MQTQIKIENHAHDGKTYRCTVQGIVFDSAANRWKGIALWQGQGHASFKRVRITAPQLDGLILAAAAALELAK